MTIGNSLLLLLHSKEGGFLEREGSDKAQASVNSAPTKALKPRRTQSSLGMWEGAVRFQGLTTTCYIKRNRDHSQRRT